MDRTFIIPDIHGHLAVFDAMLNHIGLGKNDKLYLLGDYIDRGPDSRGVVNRIIQLQADGYQLYPLRGNHEQMLLDSSDHLEDYAVMSNKRKKPFLNSEKRVDPYYLDFFSRLPFFYDLEDCILVHAGLNLRIDDPFADTHKMMWARNFDKFKLMVPKTVVHGHDPTSLGVIRSALENGDKIIPLDNGVYMKNKEFGNLLCLEWNSKELYMIDARNFR